MKCTYCGNAVVIPESLRLPKQGSGSPQVSIFSGIDMNAMVGYGTQWGEVVQLAQGGNKAQAIKKYMALTGNDESSAANTVNNLAGTQSYEFMPGNAQSVQQMYAPIMAQTAETIKKHHTHVHVDWVRNHRIRYVHHSRHDASDFDRRLRQFNASFQVAETYSKQVWA